MKDKGSWTDESHSNQHVPLCFINKPGVPVLSWGQLCTADGSPGTREAYLLAILVSSSFLLFIRIMQVNENNLLEHSTHSDK